MKKFFILSLLTILFNSMNARLVRVQVFDGETPVFIPSAITITVEDEVEFFFGGVLTVDANIVSDEVVFFTKEIQEFDQIYNIGDKFGTSSNGGIGTYRVHLESDGVIPGIQNAELSVTVTAIDGVNELAEKAKNIQVYPTVANAVVNVSELISEADALQIVDLEGRVLKTQALLSKNTVVSVADLDEGIYLLQILSSNQVIREEKIVKE